MKEVVAIPLAWIALDVVIVFVWRAWIRQGRRR